MAIIKPIINGIANIAVNDIHDHKNGSIWFNLLSDDRNIINQNRSKYK